MEQIFTDDILKYLNGLGVPLLTTAIIVLYRTLIKRTQLMQSNLEEQKSVYKSILEVNNQKAKEFEELMEKQRSFNDLYLYLKLATDTETHKDKVKEWLASDLKILENKVSEMKKNLDEDHLEIKKLRNENKELATKVYELEKNSIQLEKQVQMASGGWTSIK